MVERSAAGNSRQHGQREESEVSGAANGKRRETRGYSAQSNTIQCNKVARWLNGGGGTLEQRTCWIAKEIAMDKRSTSAQEVHEEQ